MSSVNRSQTTVIILVMKVLLVLLLLGACRGQEYELGPGVTLIRSPRAQVNARAPQGPVERAIDSLRDYSLDIKLPRIMNATSDLVASGKNRNIAYQQF